MQLLEAKLEPEEHQKEVIESLNKAAGLETTQRKRKPKRRKGPNPLSVKRSKKPFGRNRATEGGVVNKSKVGKAMYLYTIVSVCNSVLTVLISVWAMYSSSVVCTLHTMYVHTYIHKLDMC